jgi:RimJ/RimL family protein N-acetyltransferase
LEKPNMVHTEVLRTSRLRLRWFEPSSHVDQRFIVDLVSDPDWVIHIGERQVHTCEDAESYLRTGPRAMCERLGFGMFMVESLKDATPLGMCGLLRRDGLRDVDLGFAFLPEWRRRGLAREAAETVLRWGHHQLGLQRVVAIVSPANTASIGLLCRLGFTEEGVICLPPKPERLRLMGWRPGPG